MNFKRKLIIVLAVIGSLLILIFKYGLGIKTETNTGTVDPEAEGIKIIMTSPDKLEDATILPNQTISITFNKSLESSAEVKISMEPPIEYKIELSEDQKTFKLTPKNVYLLGNGYTLKILGGTKFDGKKELGRDEIFHFRTINYRGV